MESLQTICLVRVGHPHGVQDLLQSLALHHPTPIRVTGAHDCPQLKIMGPQTSLIEPFVHSDTNIEIGLGLISPRKIPSVQLLPRRVCRAQQCAMPVQHMRAPEQAQEDTSPEKN